MICNNIRLPSLSTAKKVGISTIYQQGAMEFRFNQFSLGLYNEFRISLRWEDQAQSRPAHATRMYLKLNYTRRIVGRRIQKTRPYPEAMKWASAMERLQSGLHSNVQT